MKYNRHAKILELIDNYDIETQDELVESLGAWHGCYSSHSIKRY